MVCDASHTPHLRPNTPLHPPQCHATAHRVRVLGIGRKPANTFSTKRWRRWLPGRHPERVADRGLT